MYTSLRFKHFRGFGDLKIELGRVNLICGRNSVGKSSVLEGVFLLAGAHNPALALNLNEFRGGKLWMGSEGLTFGFLLNRQSRSGSAEVSLRGKQGTKRATLKLELERRSQGVVLPISTARGANGTFERIGSDGDEHQLVFTFLHGGRTSKTRLGRQVVEADGTQRQVMAVLGEIPERTFPLAELVDMGNRRREVDHERVTRALKDKAVGGRRERLLDAIRRVEPRVEDVRIGSAGGSYHVECDIGSVTGMPLAFAGEGLKYVLKVTLACFEMERGGFLLIDDFEAGLHHSVQESVMHRLVEESERGDFQVIATTHSYECISAALAAAQAHPRGSDGLRVTRLERGSTGVAAIGISEKVARGMIESNLEMR